MRGWGQTQSLSFDSEGSPLWTAATIIVNLFNNVAPSGIMSTAGNSSRTTTGTKLSWNTNHHQQNNNSPKTLPLAATTVTNNSHLKTTNKVPPTTTTTNKASIRPTKAAAIIYPEPKKKPSPSCIGCDHLRKELNWFLRIEIILPD